MFINNFVLLFYFIFLVPKSLSQSLYNFDCDCNRTADLDVSETKINIVNFQTNKNYTCYVEEAADIIINNDNFDPQQCVHVFVPGLMTTNTSLTSIISTCSLSTTTCQDGKKPLVLVVDHSKYINGYIIQKLNFIAFYKNAVKYVKSIGVILGKLLIQLLNVIDRSLINILGHSLGAHMIGYMGDYVQQNGTSLEALYAVDPAGPCYENCPTEHIKSGNADRVMAIHTNAGNLGTTLNLTDYDMYSYNGVNQEECYFNSSIQISNPIQNFCSHNLAVPIGYTPFTLNRGWSAVKCSSASEFLNGDCDNNESIEVGYEIVPNGTTGVYFFTPSENLVCVDGVGEIYYYIGRSFFSVEIDDATNYFDSLTSLLK